MTPRLVGPPSSPARPHASPRVRREGDSRRWSVDFDLAQSVAVMSARAPSASSSSRKRGSTRTPRDRRVAARVEVLHDPQMTARTRSPRSPRESARRAIGAPRAMGAQARPTVPPGVPLAPRVATRESRHRSRPRATRAPPRRPRRRRPAMALEFPNVVTSDPTDGRARPSASTSRPAPSPPRLDRGARGQGPARDGPPPRRPRAREAIEDRAWHAGSEPCGTSSPPSPSRRGARGRRRLRS